MYPRHFFIRVTTISLSLLAVLSFSAATQAAAGEAMARLKPDLITQSAAPARQALAQARPLVTPETFRDLGFDSVEDVKRAELGEPLHIYMVRLDQLKTYISPKEPESLLLETNEVLFPVKVSGEVRTGLTLRFADGAWRFSSFGASALVRALTQRSRELSGRATPGPEATIAVRIPALHAYFIGHHEKATLFLTSAADDSRFNLHAGETLPADKVFAALAPFAREFKTGEHLVD